jgi:N-acetylglucosamine-6-phosphate deacetylase
MEFLDLDLAGAVRMASQVPAGFIGMGDRLGQISPGYQADLLALSEDYMVEQSWIKGET